MDLSNEYNQTREEILQSGIHHGTAALDYSHEGWGASLGWGIDWYFCTFFGGTGWGSFLLFTHFIHTQVYPHPMNTEHLFYACSFLSSSSVCSDIYFLHTVAQSLGRKSWSRTTFLRFILLNRKQAHHRHQEDQDWYHLFDSTTHNRVSIRNYLPAMLFTAA
ncbi:hypothetical protein HBI60_094450 [Parastagonospora nodorum]|nr:hypothetical protein HBI60_094450 [Parastagonospora nodorum]